MSATFTDIHTFEAALSVPVTFAGILSDINNHPRRHFGAFLR
jgi:hypothetical protein